MKENEYKALLIMLLSLHGGQVEDNTLQTLVDYANTQAHARGYENWEKAYEALIK